MEFLDYLSKHPCWVFFLAVTMLLLALICVRIDEERSYRLGHRIYNGEEKCQWNTEAQFITGDLVQIGAYGAVYEVLGRISKTKYLLTRNRFLKKGRFVVHVSKLHGIPLTPEELKHAGFLSPSYIEGKGYDPNVFSRNFAREGICLTIRLTYNRKSYQLKDYWDVWINSDRAISDRKGICYVHELQHFLFGLGLDYRKC